MLRCRVNADNSRPLKASRSLCASASVSAISERISAAERSLSSSCAHKARRRDDEKDDGGGSPFRMLRAILLAPLPFRSDIVVVLRIDLADAIDLTSCGMIRDVCVFKDTLDTWRPSWRGSNRPRRFEDVREESERTDSLSAIVALLPLLFARLVAFRTRLDTAEVIELCVRIEAVRACGSDRAFTRLVEVLGPAEGTIGVSEGTADKDEYLSKRF